MMRTPNPLHLAALLVVLATATYSAQTTTTNVVGDLTTITVQRNDEAGRLESRIETTWRGKEKVLTNSKISGLADSRAFYAGGERLLTENDTDGDGVFETIYLENPGRGELEMFHRSPDGAVTPVSGEELASGKRGFLLGLQTRVETLKKILAKELPEKQKIEWGKQLKEAEDSLAKFGGKNVRPELEKPPGDAGIIPPGAIHFINIELKEFLPLYKDITGAEVDTSPMGKLQPVVVRFTNTNAITKGEAIDLLNRMLYEQAGIIATNTGPNRIQFRPRGRS